MYSNSEEEIDYQKEYEETRDIYKKYYAPLLRNNYVFDFMLYNAEFFEEDYNKIYLIKLKKEIILTELGIDIIHYLYVPEDLRKIKFTSIEYNFIIDVSDNEKELETILEEANTIPKEIPITSIISSSADICGVVSDTMTIDGEIYKKFAFSEPYFPLGALNNDQICLTVDSVWPVYICGSKLKYSCPANMMYKMDNAYYNTNYGEMGLFYSGCPNKEIMGYDIPHEQILHHRVPSYGSF